MISTYYFSSVETGGLSVSFYFYRFSQQLLWYSSPAIYSLYDIYQLAMEMTHFKDVANCKLDRCVLKLSTVFFTLTLTLLLPLMCSLLLVDLSDDLLITQIKAVKLFQA